MEKVNFNLAESKKADRLTVVLLFDFRQNKTTKHFLPMMALSYKKKKRNESNLTIWINIQNKKDIIDNMTDLVFRKLCQLRWINISKTASI